MSQLTRSASPPITFDSEKPYDSLDPCQVGLRIPEA